MKKRLHVWLAMLGLLLLMPAVWSSVFHPLRLGEEQAAFESLGAVSLNTIEMQGSCNLSVTAPNNSVWERIRRAWGDPGYIIAAVSSGGKHMYCFDRLGLHIQAAIGSEPIALEAATEPLYGYSAECGADGLKFRVPPGATVNVHITRQVPRDMPPGSLVVTGYWTGETKDRLVGLMLDEDLRKILNLLAVGGFALVLSAAWLFLRRRQSAT